MGGRRGIFAPGVLVSVVLVALAAEAGEPVITRVSVSTAGVQADGHSPEPSISGDGRLVAFTSLATNLGVCVGDPGLPFSLLPVWSFHVYLRDRVAGTTVCVSVAPDGTQGNASSVAPALSADGKILAFQSMATNLVTGGCPGAAPHVFVRDLTGGVTTCIASGWSPALSVSGRFVAFGSDATDVVTPNTTPGRGHVYRHDRSGGVTVLVDVATDLAEGNASSGGAGISADGRLVAFASDASNLVVGDTNGASDVFVRDLQNATTARASVATGGAEANGPSGRSPRLSADGLVVAFGSDATNLVCCSLGVGGVYVRDLASAPTAVIANGEPTALSADGRIVAFTSAFSSFGPAAAPTGGTAPPSGPGAVAVGGPVFHHVHDRATGVTVQLAFARSVSNFEAVPNVGAAASADGRLLAFGSQAGLVAGDSNGKEDVFVARLSSRPGWLVSGAGPGGGPHLRVQRRQGPIDIVDVANLFPYPMGFAGGVHVAVGDVDASGRVDLVSGAGPGGGPHVRVIRVAEDGTPTDVASFFAYDAGFRGGVFVAAGDLDGDGQAEIITGAGGAPHVRVFQLGTGGTVTGAPGFFAYDTAFTGGVRVAAGDVLGDGAVALVTGPGPGMPPLVRVWRRDPDGTFALFSNFFAYDPAFAGGVYVAVGDVLGSGRAQVITGAGPGGGPHVRMWSIAGDGTVSEVAPPGFMAYDPAFAGGVQVGAGATGPLAFARIITGPGPGGGPNVRTFGLSSAFSGLGPAVTDGLSFFAFAPAFIGGVFPAGVPPQ